MSNEEVVNYVSLTLSLTEDMYAEIQSAYYAEPELIQDAIKRQAKKDKVEATDLYTHLLFKAACTMQVGWAEARRQRAFLNAIPAQCARAKMSEKEALEYFGFESESLTQAKQEVTKKAARHISLEDVV